MRRFFRVWLAYPWRPVVFVALVGATCLSALYTQNQRVSMKYRRSEQQQIMAPAEVHALPPNDVLPWFSLGSPHFLSDMLFIRAYMYFLGHLFSDRIYGWFDRYVDAITHLDPLNDAVYLWAARMTKFGQHINNDVVLKSNAYALEGLEHFPDDWRFYLELGFNLYFEYQASDPVEGERIKDEAIRYFAIAASLPDAEIDPNFITELYLRQNAADLAVLYAYQLYFEASERERVSLRGRIALVEQGAVDELDRLEGQWKDNFPYVPLRLAPQLGDPIARGNGQGGGS